MLEYPRREQIYLETDEYMQPGVTYAIRIKWGETLTSCYIYLKTTFENFHFCCYNCEN